MRARAKSLTVTDFWPCDLIIYWFYCTGEDMRGSDAGRQYCFLAGLKSVVDKDGGEILVSSQLHLANNIACKHHSRTSSSVLLGCSRVQTTCLACYCAIIGRCIGLLLHFLKSKLQTLGKKWKGIASQLGGQEGVRGSQ